MPSLLSDPCGSFGVVARGGRSGGYHLILHASGTTVAWTLLDAPSPDPDVMRLATPVGGGPGGGADGGTAPGAAATWDEGALRNITIVRGRLVSLADAVADGRVAVWLQGARLVGGFALTRIARGPDERWLVAKMRAASAVVMDAPSGARPVSRRTAAANVAEGAAFP